MECCSLRRRDCRNERKEPLGADTTGPEQLLKDIGIETHHRSCRTKVVDCGFVLLLHEQKTNSIHI